MLCYAAALALLGWIGWQRQLGAFFQLGLAVAAGIAVYHYSLIRGRERAACFKAFNHNNWLGGALFAGIVLAYLWRIPFFGH
jgi:4-hydroxybenzoate polyprenyltransferase